MMTAFQCLQVNGGHSPGGTPWQVRKVYAVVWPQSVVRRAIQVMRVLESCGLPTPLRELHVDPTVVGCPDALITTRIDVRSVLWAKWVALGAHRSQMGRLGNVVWLVRPVSRWLWPAEGRGRLAASCAASAGPRSAAALPK